MAWYWWYLIIGLLFAALCGLSPKWDNESDGIKMSAAFLAVFVWPVLIPLQVAEIAAWTRRLFKSGGGYAG